MSTLTRRSVFLLLSLSLFLSCNFSRNGLHITSMNFSDEVQQLQNLVFSFNHDVADDALLGRWDRTEYIRFTPAVRGKFKWVSKHELLFSPLSGFADCKDYVAKMTDKLVNKPSASKLKIDQKDIRFHTPYLAMQGMEAFWTRNAETGSPQIKLKLNFNYNVDPAKVLPLLKAKVNGTDHGFKLADAKPGKVVSAIISDKKANDENSEVEVTVEKGLEPDGIDYRTGTAFKHNLVLSSPADMSIIDVNSRYEDNIGIIEVSTSQQLEQQDFSSCYEITPNIKTSAELMENGFRIKGDFAQGVAYTLKINKKLTGSLGGKLPETYEASVFFGEKPPSISFVNKKAAFITNKGLKNIGLNIVNVPKVRLKICKIYENNILAYMNSNRYYDYDYYYEDEGYSGEGYYTYGDDYGNRFSSVLVDKLIDTKDLPTSNGVALLNVDLNDDKKFKGIYHIKVSSDEDYFLKASKLVSVSDIGLLAKESENDILVIANSLLTSDPMPNVELSLISTNNQEVYRLKTDANGIAHFKDLNKHASGFEIAMVTARQGDDFNYLLFQDNRVETSRFETDGITGNKAGWWAYIYGDRNIYRPGETIHFNSIVRDDKWKPVPNMTLRVKVLQPNGRPLAEWRKTTDEQGSVNTDVPVMEAAMTGFYTIQVYNSNDVLLNSEKVSVEEFVPDRIKVNQNLDKEFYQTGDVVNYSAEALNFFGPPAAQRSYETEFTFRAKQFYAEKFKQYSFSVRNSNKFESELKQGITDDLGMAKESYSIPQEWKDIGVVEGRIYTTVFDENGRPVNRVKSFDIYTQNTFFGIAMPDYYVGTNQALTCGLVAVDRKGNALSSARAQVDVIRYEWQSVIESEYGSYRYKSRRKETVISSSMVSFSGGKASFTYTPRSSGEYEIRVKQPGATGGTYSEFYAYGWGYTQNSSFEVSTDGEVIIETDKPKYTIGDKATLLFKTPFQGKLLVTVERNNVLEHYTLQTDQKSAQLVIDLKEDYLPNVYVTATLIKKAELSDIPLTVAHGIKPIMMERSTSRIPISIEAAEQTRSQRKQTVKVKTSPGAEVTIAVVDEGILSIRNFKTPDPYNYFYQKRALEVNSYDLYARLFPELNIGNGMPGGDGYDLEKRINPLSSNRFKPVAFWSGILKTNSSGEAEYEFDIPKFHGELRVMAVAYKNDGFASADKDMKVFDPLVVSTSLPRFLTPGDEIQLGVNMMNTTAGTATATPSVTVSGPMEIVQSQGEDVSIAPNRETYTTFRLRAKNEIGAGKVVVKVKALNETFTDETEITVRPGSTLQKRSGSGVVQGNATASVDMTTDFMPSTSKSSLLVSNSPLVQFTGNLQDLLGYPHGCIEQTISKAFPQIYFAEFVKATGSNRNLVLTSEKNNELNPTVNVNEAIRKINTFQTYSGALSYWPGGDYQSYWGSSYGLHFLAEAEKAGFEVNGSVKSRLVSYLNSKVNEQQEEKDWLYKDGVNIARTIISREKVYAIYALALAGSPNRSAMNYCKMQRTKLTTESKYLLAVAFAYAGDMASFENLLPVNYIDDNYLQYQYGSFSSPLRNKALVLNALIDKAPNNPQVISLSRSLSENLRNERYPNTQEMAFGFLALGKFAKTQVKTGGKADVFAGETKLGTYNGKDLSINSGLSNQIISIKSSGNAPVYYFWNAQGISKSGSYVQEDKGISVRKMFYNRNKIPVNLASVKQNDLIIVKITVAASFGSRVDNICITDILPAGFEIENPRITATKELEWTNDQGYADCFDIRDDRINYFTSLEKKESKVFYYMVRAVSKGTFKMGPVSADAMYDGNVHSYNGAGTVVVQ